MFWIYGSLYIGGSTSLCRFTIRYKDTWIDQNTTGDHHHLETSPFNILGNIYLGLRTPPNKNVSWNNQLGIGLSPASLDAPIPIITGQDGTVLRQVEPVDQSKCTVKNKLSFIGRSLLSFDNGKFSCGIGASTTVLRLTHQYNDTPSQNTWHAGIGPSLHIAIQLASFIRIISHAELWYFPRKSLAPLTITTEELNQTVTFRAKPMLWHIGIGIEFDFLRFSKKNADVSTPPKVISKKPSSLYYRKVYQQHCLPKKDIKKKKVRRIKYAHTHHTKRRSRK